MKKIYLLGSLVALAFVIAACTPQQQQEAADTLTGDSDASLQVPVPGADSADEMMVEDGDSMMDDGDSMMDDGDAMEAQTKVFNVGGVNFAFDVEEIRVKKGDTVTINFTSNGGFHDWVVDEFDAATERVNMDGSSSVTFVADKVGAFEYYCSVGSHRALGMVGKLIVE